MPKIVSLVVCGRVGCNSDEVVWIEKGKTVRCLICHYTGVPNFASSFSERGIHG